MSDTVVVDGVCELEIPIEGECGTFYKVNPTLEPLTATANGRYEPSGDGFSDVTVDVPLDTAPLNATVNGEYTREGGYNPVTVAIPEYEGAYTVTPSSEAQTLPTAGKVMEQDVTVGAVEPVLWKTVTLEEEYNKLGLTNFMNLLGIEESSVLAGYDYIIFAIGNDTTNSYALKIDIISVFDGYPNVVQALTVRRTAYNNSIFGRASNVGRYMIAGTVIKIYRFKR